MNTALTFHRITDKRIIDYEDVTKENLRFLFKKIYQKCESLDNIRTLNSNINNWVLTFDDGFLSDVDFVLPLLKKYKINAIFFITTSYIGKENYMNWEQIKYLSESGAEIGSHSVNHVDMLSLSYKEIQYELNMSRDIIEDNISKKVDSFSFPFGRCNSKVIKEVFKSGYLNCFTSKPSNFNNNENTIPRLAVNSSMSKNDLSKLINNCGKINYTKLFDYNIKNIAKKLLGIKNYWLIRNFIIGQK